MKTDRPKENQWVQWLKCFEYNSQEEEFLLAEIMKREKNFMSVNKDCKKKI